MRGVRSFGGGEARSTRPADATLQARLKELPKRATDLGRKKQIESQHDIIAQQKADILQRMDVDKRVKVFTEVAKKDIKLAARTLSAMEATKAGSLLTEVAKRDTVLAARTLSAIETTKAAGLLTEVAKKDLMIAARMAEKVKPAQAGDLLTGMAKSESALTGWMLETMERTAAIQRAASMEADGAARAFAQMDGQVRTDMLERMFLDDAARIAKHMEPEVAADAFAQMDSHRVSELLTKMAEIEKRDVAGPWARGFEKFNRHLKVWAYAYTVGIVNLGVAADQGHGLPSWSTWVSIGIANVAASTALRPHIIRGQERQLRFPWNGIALTAIANGTTVALSHLMRLLG